MDSTISDEEIIKTAIELLSSLTSSFSKKIEDQKEVKNLDDALHLKVSSVRASDAFKSLQKIFIEEERNIGELKTQSRWAFVMCCLYLMEIVRNTILRTEDEKTKLLSISQKVTLEIALQFVISLGILQYLIIGVGVPLEEKSKYFACVKPENLTDFAKYKRLCFIVDAVLNLYTVDVFHEIIILKHLEDVLAALLQLSFAPFKKPISPIDDSVVLNLESLDDAYKIERMTYSVWNKLEDNRRRFNSRLTELQNKLYRPLIIRKYMILLGLKKTPRWLKKKLTNMLTELVLEDNGVVATVKGIVEVGNESPTLSSHCTTVAKLISAIFCDLDESKIRLLSSQLEKILSNDRRQSYDYIFIQVVAVAIAEMLQRCRGRTEKYLLDAVLNPLKNMEHCSKEEICSSINQIYNLCIVPSNNSVAVPINIIMSVSSVLFFIYVHIKDSVCYLKSLIKEILGKLLLEAADNTLARLLDNLMFNESVPEVVQVAANKKIVLTSDGSVEVVDGDAVFSEFENGVVLLQLIKGLKDNEKLVSSLFTYLLKKYVSTDANEEYDTKRVVIVLVLAELSQNPDTLNHILKNAENIIRFVQELLNMHSDEEDQNEDIIRVCLTFLTMVLYDLRKKKNVNWQPFQSLVPSLKKLKSSHLPNVMLLAEEVHSLIITRNVIGGATSKSNSLIEEIPKSACEKAIEDACDTLLPVRAHALMELISLIQKGDPETLAKKEKIFCVFKENLKDKDSFLYLRAIEGLASLTVLKTEDVLPLMCQEFILCTTAEIRLKVGEILTRTVKLSNDFIYKYKKLLVNTFLTGIKDEDSLVRASSLSNLGEVCVALKSNIADVLYEVIQYAQTVAISDTNVEPRRAAVFLISSLFRGLKRTMLQVLESSLLELYRTLKRIHLSDEDEVVRVQAELSLNVLNENMKEIFSTKPLLEKKIHVLDPF